MAEERKSGGGAAATAAAAAYSRLRASADDRKAASAGAAGNKKVILKSADMKEEMQKEAIDCSLAAFEKHGVEKEIAEYIKKEFDKNHSPAWHCIVGRNFGSYVTYETNHFIYFYWTQKLSFYSNLVEG